MFYPHDEQVAVYEGDMTDMHAVDVFLRGREMPTLSVFSHDVAERMVSTANPKMPALMLFANEHDKTVHETYMAAASYLRGRCIAVEVAPSALGANRVMDMVGVDESSLPAVRLMTVNRKDDSQWKKYKFEGEITVHGIVDWVDAFHSGKIQPYLRSEPVPGEQYPGQPVVVVGSTFVDQVTDVDQDVLVNIYAPWCGHCHKFEPTYRSLAKKLQHVESLKIVKIDGTRNEIPNLHVSAYPTVLLYPRGNHKAYVPYRGNRSIQDMTDFLLQHVTTKFDPVPPSGWKPPGSGGSGLLTEEEEQSRFSSDL